jgi:hypothetical protein
MQISEMRRLIGITGDMLIRHTFKEEELRCSQNSQTRRSVYQQDLPQRKPRLK